MTETRRNSDTIVMSREDIEAALAAQHRDTLPLPVQQALAESQGIPATVCPLCHQGLVTPEAAARVQRSAEEEQVTTQPVGPRGR